MDDAAFATAFVRALGAVLLVLGGWTVVGAALLGRIDDPVRQQNVFGGVVVVPVLGLLVVACSL